MTKAELISTVAKEAKTPKATAERILNAFQGVLAKVLKRGDKLILTGYMSFSVGKRKARKGRNPQTGEEIKIPAGRVVKFKAGNLLKSAVK